MHQDDVMDCAGVDRAIERLMRRDYDEWIADVYRGLYPRGWNSAGELVMRFHWSAFCLQWVAISWCAVIGKEQP